MLKPMDIDRYINMAEENFSGVDGDEYDNYIPTSQMDLDFDGDDDVSNADGYYYADANEGRSQVPAKQPTPYQVNCSNTTPSPLTVVLFGKNQYLLTPNFGSSVGVTVIPSQVNVTYLELLQQSSDQPFETSLMRVQTSNTSQLTQILNITSKDANGQLCQLPIITQSYFSANQFQSGILDVPYPVKVDGNTNVSFTILGNTSVVITFFPASKVNTARILGGKNDHQIYGSPVVPVAVPMFTARPTGIHRRPKMIRGSQR